MGIVIVSHPYNCVCYKINACYFSLKVKERKIPDSYSPVNTYIYIYNDCQHNQTYY